jgi:hypothetical protein
MTTFDEARRDAVERLARHKVDVAYTNAHHAVGYVRAEIENAERVLYFAPPDKLDAALDTVARATVKHQKAVRDLNEAWRLKQRFYAEVLGHSI